MPICIRAAKGDLLCLKTSVKASSDREEVQASVSKCFLTRKYNFLEVSKGTGS